MTTPLTIITGFLGAGKTTLLNRILNGDHGLRVAVLVNDFGSVNIDSELVAATSVDGDTISLSNGCICCTIRGDLLQAVEDVFKTEEPPEYVIIETSGVSDPLEVALTFRDVPRMQELVHIDSIITLIDAEQFNDLRHDNEYTVLAMNQVGMADIIVLNKVDLVGEAALAEVEKSIQQIMPGARVFKTTQGHVPLELLLGVGTYDPQRTAERAPADVHVYESGAHHDHAHTDHSTVFDTWSWTTTKPLSLPEVQRATQKLPPSVFRLKGILYTQDEPETRLVLHVVGRRVTLTREGAWGAALPNSHIVAIGKGGGVDNTELDALFTGTLYENAPKSGIERLARGVMSWLR